jgi:lipopolysaccharide transport system ATP-binding protein
MKIGVGPTALDILDAVEAFQFKVQPSKNMTECSFYQPRSWKVIDKLTLKEQI